VPGEVADQLGQAPDRERQRSPAGEQAAILQIWSRVADPNIARPASCLRAVMRRAGQCRGHGALNVRLRVYPVRKPRVGRHNPLARPSRRHRCCDSAEYHPTWGNIACDGGDGPARTRHRRSDRHAHKGLLNRWRSGRHSLSGGRRAARCAATSSAPVASTLSSAVRCSVSRSRPSVVSQSFARRPSVRVSRYPAELPPVRRTRQVWGQVAACGG
jgi:hypothetical protein